MHCPCGGAVLCQIERIVVDIIKRIGPTRTTTILFMTDG